MAAPPKTLGKCPVVCTGLFLEGLAIVKNIQEPEPAVWRRFLRAQVLSITVTASSVQGFQERSPPCYSFGIS